MKISIERLKEIIMEEVARATAIEEEGVPGSEDDETTPPHPVEEQESLNIEIVED